MSPGTMPEAEVALRLAFYLVRLPGAVGEVHVYLDGAHARIGNREVFAVGTFLASAGWEQTETRGRNAWQGTYRHPDGVELLVDAKSGKGDVVCRVGGVVVRAECKKGPLNGRKGNPEYPLLREALGQLLTVKHVEPHDLLVVAVPNSPQFQRLAAAWRQAPLVQSVGIKIALVGRDGGVNGLAVREDQVTDGDFDGISST